MQPSRNDHFGKARRNRDFAYNLPKKDPTHVGWALTALFYSALHYVEGYLAHFNHRVNGHKALNAEIDRNPALCGIYETYQELADYAYNARYRMRNYYPGDFDQAKASFALVEQHITDLCP